MSVPLGCVIETASPPAVKCSGERWEAYMENNGKEGNENCNGNGSAGNSEVIV